MDRPNEWTERSPEVALTSALHSVAGRGATLVLSFLFAIGVARALEPSLRGDFALLQALNGFVLVAVNFAVSGAIIYHVGKGALTIERSSRAASSLALLSSALGALLFIPLSLLINRTVFPGISPLLLVAAIVLVTPLLLREYLGGTMIATHRSLDYVVAHAVQPLGSLLALLLIAALGTTSLTGVSLSWAAGIVLSGLAAVLLISRYASPLPLFSGKDTHALARFGVRMYPALVVRFLNLRLDQFIVRLLSSSATLGQYAVAVSVGELLIRIPTNMLWAFSGSISAARKEQSADLVAQFCRWSLIVIVAVVILIAVAAPAAVPMVFGQEYRPAVSSILLLLPGLVCYAPATIVVEYFMVQRGDARKATFIAGTSLVTSTILNFPLTPRFGADGASAASSISYIVMLITALMLFKRDTGLKVTAPVAVTRNDAAAVLSSLVNAVRGIRRRRTKEPGLTGQEGRDGWD
jgi:O-antigen/teichoic acid export membrane protein